MANIIYTNNHNVTLEVLDGSVNIFLNGSELLEASVYNLVSGDDITIQSYRTYLSFIIEIFDVEVSFEEKLNNYKCNRHDRLKYIYYIIISFLFLLFLRILFSSSSSSTYFIVYIYIYIIIFINLSSSPSFSSSNYIVVIYLGVLRQLICYLIIPI